VAATREIASGARKDPTRSGRADTILVVDDNGDDFDLLRLMFRRARIANSLQRLETVRDAICYLKGEGIYEDRDKYPFPILLLLDLHLSDGTGFEVLDWLRRNRSKSPTAVVVLTGSDTGAIRQSYALGAHSFLTKPLRFEDFQNLVAHARGISLRRSSEGWLVQTD